MSTNGQKQTGFPQGGNPFWDSVTQMQKSWGDMFQNMTGAFAGQSANPMAAGMENVDPLAAARVWTHGLKQTLDQGFSTASAALEGLPNFLDNLRQAAAAYSSVLEMWASIPSRKADGPVAFFESASSFFEKSFGWSPATGIPGMGATKGWHSATASMMGNWADFVADVSRRAGQRLKTEDLDGKGPKSMYEAWRKTYDETLGRFLNLPAVGPNRVDVERLEQSFDAYVKYQAAQWYFQEQMLKTGVAALEEVMDEADSLFKGDVNEETFDRFFQLLMSVGERHYHELFTSDPFRDSLEALVSTGLDYHKATNELMEEVLRYTPIVTQSQADEMHKEIYLLKKRVRELEREREARQGDE